MKMLLYICLVSLVAEIAWSQEPMTSEQFKKLVDAPGDTNALRPELASLPFWRNAKCSVSLKYEDGRVFKEECAQTAKTVGGKYIVFSTDSQYYKQTMHAIAGYDENALAIREWGLFGDTLTETTMIFDPEKKISGSTSAYAGGFMEISVGSYSEKEMSDHTLVYKDGVLFMTRDVKTRPIAAPTRLEQDGATNGGPPADVVRKTIQTYQVGVTTFTDFKEDAKLEEMKPDSNKTPTHSYLNPELDSMDTKFPGALPFYTTSENSPWKILEQGAESSSESRTTSGIRAGKSSSSSSQTSKSKFVVGDAKGPVCILIFDGAGKLAELKPLP
jgi:hypothetical protein